MAELKCYVCGDCGPEGLLDEARSVGVEPTGNAKRTSRVALICAVALALAFALGATGCGSSDRQSIGAGSADPIVGDWYPELWVSADGETTDLREDGTYFDENGNGAKDAGEAFVVDIPQTFTDDGRWACDYMEGKYGAGAGSWENITDETLSSWGTTMDEFLDMASEEIGRTVSKAEFYRLDGGTEYETNGVLLYSEGDCVLYEYMSDGDAYLFRK